MKQTVTLLDVGIADAHAQARSMGSPSHSIFLRLTASLVLLAGVSMSAEPPSSACLREYAVIHSLETGFSADETPAQRASRTRTLLATKQKMTPEAVAQLLSPLVKKLLQDTSASKLDRACANYIEGAYAEAQTHALDAGDAAHRAEPRQPADVISALRLAAFAAMEQAKYEDAVKFLGVALGETTSDRDLPTWTQLQTATARAYAAMKLPQDEIQTLRYILSEHERILGPLHADTVRHHSTLAGTFYQQGRDEDAERETRTVLKSTLKLYGSQHDQTQVVRKNLARVLEALGRHADAEPYRREVLTVQMGSLGGGSAITLRSHEQLVKNLLTQDKFAEAEAEARTLTDHSARAGSPDSVITLGARLSLVLALQGQKKHEEALKDLHKLTEDTGRVVGTDHAETLRVQHALGVTLNALKQYPEAEKVLADVLAVRKRVLPPDDITLFDTHHQLSISFLEQEKVKPALDELREALLGYERIVGKKHPKYEAVNQTTEALVKRRSGKDLLIQERQNLVAATAKKMGVDHRQTIIERINMADMMKGVGESKAALLEYKKAHESCRRTLGADHPGTVMLLQSMASLMLQSELFAEAEPIYREIHLKSQKLQPQDKVKIEEASYNLGICLANLGKVKEARGLVQTSFELAKERPNVNPKYLAVMKSICDQLEELDKPLPINVPATGTLLRPLKLVIEEPSQGTRNAGTPIFTDGGLPFDASSMLPAASIQQPLELTPKLTKPNP